MDMDEYDEGITFEILEGQNIHQGPIVNPEIVLSDEQKHVLALVRSGQNVFFTGPAGTGKSVLLKAIIKQFQLDLSPDFFKDAVRITASTGIAGLNIGGTTLHSFAGIGLGKAPQEMLLKQVEKSGFTRQRWRDIRTLIVDEISMVDGTLFDKLEFIARKIRGNPAPFGGIQLVLSGDFFQLPPVPDHSHHHVKPAVFAFHARTWPLCIARPIFLTKVFRQKDHTFVDLLNNMRYAQLTEGDEQQLMSLSRPLHYTDGIEPSELFPLRDEVRACNTNRLLALPEPELQYMAMDFAGEDLNGVPLTKKHADTLLERMVAPAAISLRIGAQVMLIQNMVQGELVNGSLGKVIEFVSVHDAFINKIGIAQNLPTSERHGKEKPFPPEGLRQLNTNVFPRDAVWPLVLFDNGYRFVCSAIDFTSEGFLGNIEARRTQVPLILAWALSIHKSQGQTLSRVKIDLGRTFEKGQAYVAVSRATSMEGLEIQNFQAAKVMADPRVIAWHQFWTAYGEGETDEALSDEDCRE